MAISVYDRATGRHDKNAGSLVCRMDALSDMLRAAHLTGGVFLNAAFTAPWCIATQMTPKLCAPYLGAVAHLIPYHCVLEGELWIALEGQPPQPLRRGEVLLLPRNDPHLMGSDLGLRPISGRDVILPPQGGSLHAIRHGGGGALVRMVCGYLGCDIAYGNPVVATLPAAMRVQLDEAGPAQWICSTFQYAASEVAGGRAGSETVLAKLSELLFIEAVRRFVEELPPSQTGWLAGLRDPAVGRALALMHAEMARSWSVDELGREIGMSRSVLAERFSRLIGMAPMHYLAHWRMQVAAQQLKATDSSLAQVAELVGYESEAAFSRAFKKKFGTAPATWRRAED
jgi:AraC-like DNA-binding protein